MSNLYIVSTPIGNLQDITIRAARAILETEVLITESTSKAGLLLEYLKGTFPSIEYKDKKIVSLTEDEEEQKIPSLLKFISTQDAVLISEAGTPLISDPGFKLIRSAIKEKINVIPIPGATAVIAALTGSGLPTNNFTFLGFLPKSNQKKALELKKIKDGIPTTVILFESPHRIFETVDVIEEVFGDIEIVIARELTKIHEEFIRMSISNVRAYFKEKEPKGELVILFSTKN